MCGAATITIPGNHRPTRAGVAARDDRASGKSSRNEAKVLGCFKVVLILLLVALALLWAIHALMDNSDTRETPTMVTLDGYDPVSGLRITIINVWKVYGDPSEGIVGKGYDGDRVELVKREGDYVMIRLSSKRAGWVSYGFIKEFK